MSEQKKSAPTLKHEPKFVGEFESVKVGTKVIKMKDDDLHSPIPTKDRYNNVNEYIRTYRALARAEYEGELKAKAQLQTKMILEFKLAFTKMKNGGEYNIWNILIPVKVEQIDYEGTKGYSYINLTDEVVIEWDPEKNPEDIVEDFSQMRGKITRIRQNIVHVSFELASRFRPPDYVDHVPNGEKRPPKIEYNVKFVPSSAIFKRRMAALEALREYPDDSIIKRVILGNIPKTYSSPAEQFKGDLSGLELTPRQEQVAKASATRAISVIQGPPGCGKTHVIGAIATACLQQHPKERILICGTSNTSVENLIRVIGRDVESIGREMTWLAARTKDFDHDDDLKEEQTYLMYYRMINRNTVEGVEFGELQRKSWDVDLNAAELYRSDMLREILEKQISKESNVIVATLESAAKSCLSELKFETVIIDEATQACEPASLIPLIHGAQRWILVGDQKQLGPVVPSENVFRDCHYDVSIFERLTDRLKFKYDFLDCQFRMHPLISEFSNRNFYNGNIRDMVTEADRMIETNVIPNNIVFINVDGQEEHGDGSTSYTNEKEAQVVISIVSDMLRGGTKGEEIGVISPYSAQTRNIRTRMDVGKIPLKIATVDSFQGSQREYIIISAVRTSLDTIGFLKNYRRFNVSITRARRALVIVGNEKALCNDAIWGDYINFCKQFPNSYFNGGLKVVNPIPKVKKSKAIDPSLIYKPLNPPKVKIERPTKQMENFVFKISGKTMILGDDVCIGNYSAKSGKNMRDIMSSIAKSNVRVLWPDVKEDMDELKRWTDGKLNKLAKKKNVTLAYDSECVCLQLGEVFPETFDIFKWKQDTPIPKVNPNDGIIVLFYNKGDDKFSYEGPKKILKPLLEHPHVTLLTYDFTADIELLMNFGINVNKTRIIDGQLLSAEDNQEELISTTRNRSLKMAIKKMKNKDSMTFNAKREIVNGEKDFPWNANMFLIKQKNLPMTSIVSTDFLSYSANDIFLTALIAVEVMTQNELDSVIQKTREKMKQFTSYWKDYHFVSSFREAEYCRLFYTVIMQGSIQDTDRIDQLLSRWNELSKYQKNINLNNEKINQIMNIDQETKETVKRKLEKVTKILNEQRISHVRMVALLANPKEGTPEGDDGVDEDEIEALDSFF